MTKTSNEKVNEEEKIRKTKRICEILTSEIGLGINFAKPENFVKLMETSMYLPDTSGQDDEIEKYTLGELITSSHRFFDTDNFINDVYYTLIQETCYRDCGKLERNLTKKDIEIIKDAINSTAYWYIKEVEPLSDSGVDNKCLKITELCNIYVDFTKPENFTKLMNIHINLHEDLHTLGEMVTSTYGFTDSCSFLWNLEYLLDEKAVFGDEEEVIGREGLKEIISKLRSQKWVLR